MSASPQSPVVDAIESYTPQPEDAAGGIPQKLKGRQRLLQNLQRISSSPSLSRKRASSSPYSTRYTLSSASLSPGSSPSSLNSLTYPFSGPSTAPTSVPGSPFPDASNLSGVANRLAIRSAENQGVSSGLCTPTTIHESSPVSRGPLSGLRNEACAPDFVEDYFSRPVGDTMSIQKPNYEFWTGLPYEIQLTIFRFLTPKELVKASIICKSFYRVCYDGQLWTSVDASDFYKDIPADSLAKIVVSAGPFVKELNLRGCVQVEHYRRAEVVAKACRNLENAILQGCRNFQQPTLHLLLANNERLGHINLSGLTAVDNKTCKVIAKHCPQLESFNVSWCTHMDARGIRTIIRGCPRLKDLRAGEIRGFASPDIAESVFFAQNLERLVLSGCSDIDDVTLQTMIYGIEPEWDILEDRPIVSARKFRHLDISRCPLLTDKGVNALAYNVPYLEGLQLGGCVEVTDAGLEKLLATSPNLTHLDLEEVYQLTNTLLSEHLAKSPCARRLEHLSISYCENLGDSGMLPVIKQCKSLKSIDMDNTRISDLVLAEAASMVRERSKRTTSAKTRPRITLNMVIFDCPNVTWTGVREVLSRNAEIRKPASGSNGTPTYPTQVIGMKCFYGYQMTVDEHTARVLGGNLAGAGRLERRWADHMMMHEEAGVPGTGARRRRRRAREAAMLHADEEEGGVGMGGIGRRRRARSGGCSIM